MEIYSPNLFIEINNSNYIFAVGDINEERNFKLIYKLVESAQGMENSKIINFDLILNIIKKNIYLIEQKLNFTFKEVVLIIDDFNCSFINVSGFKKLNGSQVLKENITYILNSLKSNVSKNEDKKTILHIFNTKYFLDKKKIENLPIGLFGDFYSHELSFCLINNNNYKNIKNLFNKSNLKIKKILLKSFVEGTNISNKNEDLELFYQIKINNNHSQISFFENDSLKFEQNFNFGSDLVLRDISKITSLKIDIVKNIINDNKFTRDFKREDLIEKDIFENENYVKIKKKLIFEIAEARIHEFFNLLINKNINLLNYNKQNISIFLKINDKSHLKCFKDTYNYFFSKNGHYKIKFIDNFAIDDFMNDVNRIVHFGWKKEAIPVTHIKKTVIARIFDAIFS